jgi:PHD/YefM family antitoxin component YafN of YafNO toxin-antitoxin module
MKTYTYSEARQNLAALLDEAAREGEVMIRRRDGNSYVLRPVRLRKSPLDVEGVDVDLSTDEIVEAVRESRRRRR